MFQKKQNPNTRKVIYKSLDAFNSPKWTKKNGGFPNDIHSDPEPLLNMQRELYNELKDMSPLKLFYKFFDDEVLNFIVDSTLILLSITRPILFSILRYWKHFSEYFGAIRIPYITIHTWLLSKDHGVPIVKQSMTRAWFREIKCHIHFCDINNLDPKDKIAKVR